MARFTLDVGYATDIGRLRKRNEDSFAVLTPPDAAVDTSAATPLQAMLLVADGMGGERAGDRASQMAAEGLHQFFASGLYRSWPEYIRGNGWVEPVLRRAMREVNQEILRLGEENPALAGLGTTVVLAMLTADRMTIAHVGDSRCYRVRSGTIEQLTTDHTLVERQVAAGLLTPDQARRHPHRNVLTRSLGDSESPRTDVRSEAVEAGDVFLLCSDGLTGGLGDEDLLAVLDRETPPQGQAETLVEMANQRDGSDNITVVVGRCRGGMD